MENSNIDPSSISINDALSSIGGIKTAIASMGGNDSEFNVLDDIVNNLQEGSLTPEEALEQANKVLLSKQDYH